MTEQQIPKGYKLTEVGVIPEDWDVKAVRNIAEVDPENLKSDTDPNYEFDYISLEQIKEGVLLDTQHIKFKESPSRARRKIRLHDVLISTVRPNLKSHYIISENVKDFICSTGFSVIRLDANRYNPFYLFFHLFSQCINGQIETLITGSNYPAINSEHVRDLLVPFPIDIKEQTAIANVLSDTDALISQLKKLIAKKQAIKTATMQQLLTGKTRLPEFAYKADGSLKGTKTNELGEIPEDWDIYEFGCLVDYIKGYPFKSSDYTNDGIRIIRVSDTTYDSIKMSDPVFIVERESKKYKRWELREGDLIFSTVGSKPPMYDSLVGKVILVIKKYAGTLLNQNAVLIRSKSKALNFNYLLLNHFRTKRYIEFIKTIYRGNANQASITLENLFQYKIPLSRDAKEQTAIATILTDMDQEITTLEQRLTKTEQIKQGMMQQLLTGKIRLISL